MKLGPQTLSLHSLIYDGWLDTEMRVSINKAKVQQYAEEMKHHQFPEAVVFLTKAQRYLVGDGFHRLLAEQFNGKRSVKVEVKYGEYLDAVLFNIEANKAQKGLPFSTGDKQRCIITLLTCEESRGWTQTKIAETVGTAQGYVSQVVTAWKENGGYRPDKIVDKNGVERRAPMTKDAVTVEERRTFALNQFKQGVPKIEIARNLGITRFAVQRYISNAVEERDLVPCPHCHGTGMVSNLRPQRSTHER